MKMDEVRFGRGSTVAEDGLVFYGATIGANAKLLRHGVVVKYDHLSQNKACTEWPVHPTDHAN
jgi:hypothetical protein